MLLPSRLGLFFAVLMLSLAWPARAECDACTLSVTKVQGKDLRFGSMVVISGGSISMNPSTGVRSGTASVVTPTSLSSSEGPAEFKVTCNGSGSTRYTVALWTTPATIGTPSSITMDLTDFVTSPAVSVERTVANCAAYEEIVKVGATLQVSATQAPGSYTTATEIELNTSIF